MAGDPPSHAYRKGQSASDHPLDGEASTRRQRAAATGTRAAMSLVRFIALVGIVGLAIIAGAIMSSQGVQGWIEGLVIGAGAVILTAVVFLSRRLAR
jgi:hypothetical protein